MSPRSDADAFRELSRDELMAEARAMGVSRPGVMPREELVAELVRLNAPPPAPPQPQSGWFGTARSLLASVVEQGLNLPDAAKLIRGETRLNAPPEPPCAVPTVTLADIYAAQGHTGKALRTLDEILAAEPEHAAASALKERIKTKRAESRKRKSSGDAPSKKTSTTGRARENSVSIAARAAAVTTAPPVDPSPEMRGSPVEATPDSARSLQEVVTPDPSAAARVNGAPAKQSSQAEELSAVESSRGALTMRAVGDAAVGSPVDIDASIEVSGMVTAIAGDRLLAYWEVSRRSLQGAQSCHPEGQLVLRLSLTSPSWEGATQSLCDLPLVASVSMLDVAEIVPGAVARCCVGWRYGSGFAPLAVAARLNTEPEAELELPIGVQVSAELVERAQIQWASSDGY